ncbi:hypothetical protein Anapl_07861 [Anas platyrhynchos]|uniref:Uncharacterized protein n=1 Tax=Anas platyrhynchos TaxID=8839 RepID=R0KN06_ANAPL|nr:hypothetical protein Anapl_07861 [Anas platyrhynchos]
MGRSGSRPQDMTNMRLLVVPEQSCQGLDGTVSKYEANSLSSPKGRPSTKQHQQSKPSMVPPLSSPACTRNHVPSDPSLTGGCSTALCRSWFTPCCKDEDIAPMS